MEQRERKERKENRKEKRQAKGGFKPWHGLLIIALLMGLVYAWFFLLKITPLPERIQNVLYPTETAPLPAATPELSPTPEPTTAIPKPDVSIYTAKLTVEQQTIYGSMRLHYVNNSADTLYSIPLHLYPNTLSPDTVTVQRLSLNGISAYYTVEGDILEVPLALEIEPGGDCVIYAEFTVNLTGSSYGRLISGKRELPYILPAAGVYENGWLTDATMDQLTYTAPATYSVMVEGAVSSASIPEAEPGHFYGENAQGVTITLR
ncbi:MAG: hypothetical protein PUC76_02085 [Clostridia bacterium]|nr:hypothetical protein [Clostridia bacterium]